jgi:acetyl esterase/lipase
MALQLDSDAVLRLGEMDPSVRSHLAETTNAYEPETIETRKSKGAEIETLLFKRFETLSTGIRRTIMPYNTTDGVSMRSILFQPQSNTADAAPLIFLIHGGGFLIGCPEFEEETCLNLVRKFGAVCYSISYRLAPEHKFPTAVNDCWDAFNYCISQAQSWGADPVKDGFIVGGTSAGGNLAATIAHMARDGNVQPPITGQYLANPWLCSAGRLPEPYRSTSRAYEQNRNAPALTADTITMYTSAYAPIAGDDLFDVISHSNGHTNLPPTFFQVCGMDPLRDDGLVYEHMLRVQYGISTKLVMYAGLPHSFWLIFPGLKDHIEKFRVGQLDGFAWLLK